MLEFMRAALSVPALWGLAGGLFYGALGVITAFSARVGNPVARRKAILELLAGVFFAPVVAEAFTGMVLTLIPGLAMPAVALTLGLMTVPYAPAYLAHIKGLVDKRLGGRE